MILCIDIGNSIIHFGLFSQDKLILQLEYNSKNVISSDQLGLFLVSALKKNDIDIQRVKEIFICSVFPEWDYQVELMSIKYFSITPIFLTSNLKLDLKLHYSNPSEIGADRLANAIAAINLYPSKNIIIVDLGTATTICAISKHKEYYGGAIIPGMKSLRKSLASDTAKLPLVQIAKPKQTLGQNTEENILIGIYYGVIGAIKSNIEFISKHAFKNDNNFIVIGTGGFANLYEDEALFNFIIKELSLIGLSHMTKLK
jgi:type III pantothenate kinase